MDVMLRLVQEMTQKLQQVRSDLHDKFPDQRDDEQTYGDFSLSPKDPTCEKLAEVVFQRIYEDQQSQTSHTTADAERQFDKNIAKAIISSLHFDDLHKRYDDIPTAYEDTLQWVWQEPRLEDGQTLWDSFTEWLRSEDTSVYWITGKAGSGKSTLMKYLQTNPNLEKNLSAWRRTVSDKPLLVLGYYAWYPAKFKAQKSIDGLRRTILYEAVKQDPTLISTITPRRCVFHCILQGHPCPRDWTSEELAEGISNLLAKCTSLRLVIFIDGLDEFSLPPKQLIDAILRMVKDSQKAIKVCAASRPWPEFRDSLEEFPSMKVHHLTQADLGTVVSREFANCKAYSERGPEAQRLKDAILEKAGGVFLWVTVVTRLIIGSLDRGDTTAQLKKVIEDLPEEMADLYDHIWNRVRPSMRSEASRIILLLEASFHKLHYVTLWMEGEMHAEPFALPPRTAFMDDEMERMKKTITRRLHSRTYGLLELDSENCVTYLHRTAYEWRIQQDLLPHAKGFNPDIPLIRVFRLLATRTDQDQETHELNLRPMGQVYLFVNVIYHAGRIAAAVEKPPTQELATAAACLTEFRAEMTDWRFWRDETDSGPLKPFAGCKCSLLNDVELKEAVAALGVEAKNAGPLQRGLPLITFKRTHLRYTIFLNTGNDRPPILLGDKDLLNAEGVLDPESRLGLVKSMLDSGVAPSSKDGRTCSYAKLGRELRAAAKKQGKTSPAWAAWYSDVADLLFKDYVDSHAQAFKDTIRNLRNRLQS